LYYSQKQPPDLIGGYLGFYFKQLEMAYCNVSDIGFANPRFLKGSSLLLVSEMDTGALLKTLSEIKAPNSRKLF